MTRPRLVPFQAAHVMALANRDTAAPEDWRFALERERSGPAFTAVVGDTVLGCGGLLLPWPGFGLVWLAVSADASRYGIWLTRTVRRVLADTTRAYGLRRLEAVVRAECVGHARWLEVLGFTREAGCARAYAPDGADGLRYERVEVA